MDSFIGIDIGGTSIKGIRLKGDSIEETSCEITRAEEALPIILSGLYEVVASLINNEVRAIGVGVPGILNVKEGKIIAINNIPEFNGFKLKKALEKKFDLPVLINNDANCFALSEAYFGAGKPFQNIIGITLGTGVGGGIVFDRKLYSGNLGAAGEFGSIPYKEGFFEDYGGSRFFERQFQKSAKELYDEAQAGNQEARKGYRDYGKHIAWLIEALIPSLSPEAVIIGGSIAKAFPYFEGPIREMLSRFALPILAENVRILPAQTSDSGTLGAAALCLNEYREE